MPEAFLSFPARSRERTVILTLPVMTRSFRRSARKKLLEAAPGGELLWARALPV
jgi:hypothetical protein